MYEQRWGGLGVRCGFCSHVPLLSEPKARRGEPSRPKAAPPPRGADRLSLRRRGSASSAGSHPRERSPQGPGGLVQARDAPLRSAAARTHEGHPRWSRGRACDNQLSLHKASRLHSPRWLLGHRVSGGQGDRRPGGRGTVTLGVRKRAQEAVTFLGDDQTPGPWRAEDKTFTRWKRCRGARRAGTFRAGRGWRQERCGVLEGPSGRRRPRGGLADPL